MANNIFLRILNGLLGDSSTKELDKKRAEELKSQQIDRYRDFLEKLASNRSEEVFSNGGVEYASVLMSILFKNTEKIARIYSRGFRPDLITTEPYWSELKSWLEKPDHHLLVLVETDKYINHEPLQMLHNVMGERAKNHDKGLIIVKVISQEKEQKFLQKYGQECNFAIFDDNKFRYEYDPNNFKAFGSFNQPETCRNLINDFDDAFNDKLSLSLFN